MKTILSLFSLIIVSMLFIGAFPQATEDFRAAYILENEAEKRIENVVVPEVRMLVVGDMMFDRTLAKVAASSSGAYIFSCIVDYLDGFDVTVGNLEGTITEYPSRSLNTKPGEPGNTTFTFPTTTATLLRTHGITAVSLANNHIFDFGRDGVLSTKQYLEASGIGYFGDPLDTSHKSLVINKENQVIALVGFNQFLGVDSIEGTLEEIVWLRPAVNHIIVYAHWGDEYVPANETQKNAARAFIDAGADVVIGAHPHVIQEHELYKEKHIYYSLGNFIFDQYWEEAVSTGLGLELLLTPKGISFSEQLFTLHRDGRTCLKEKSTPSDISHR